MKLTLKDIKKRLVQSSEKPVPSKPAYLFPYYDVPQPLSIDSYQLAEGLFYYPHYIEPETESRLMDTVLAQQSESWVPVRGRRLQMWGGTVTAEGLEDPQPLPQWVDFLADRLLREGVFAQRPNHALVNDYQPGEGIMAHTDGPAYFPQVAIVSLGSTTTFQFWTLKRVPYLSLVVEPGSLLLFSGKFYTDFLHSIEAKPVDDWLTASCGKLFTEVAGLLSEIVNLRAPAATPLDSEFSCPHCGQKLACCGGTQRGRRVSMTIRVVPPLASAKTR